ncbi:DUF4242 domain-containing protein [Chryseolinea lacunae]|uniref:DUF4242 domain-containing protein n=1 Tax=Chryseolinea lacunae TaxID=2801331 RepID=A0ABS1KNA3_9BACT|nr:DUF4242 domain-containing protein [Chryseolinea lacunae]MBL0740939.1 DUF4242 domain-containing protein [Chryseolinea lacunae]
MKNTTLVFLSLISVLTACDTKVNEPDTTQDRRLYIDVHDLEPGKVTLQDVAGAHQKDLATQGKYGVSFLKYWVDEAKGKVYCLSESPSDSAIYRTHQEAHGLVPDLIAAVSDGEEAPLHPQTPLYFDVHYLGAGNVTAKAVADAHVKDLAVQEKYKTSFINYWVDEKRGIVMCLAEAPDSAAMVATHKEAHGLIPQEVHSVQQGN